MSPRALLLTDVVDSTALVERAGDVRAAQVWAAHDRHARQLLAGHRGREIDRTDGFFLVFDDATDAAAYAVAYHQALADLGLMARVGIHVGAVTLRENAPDDIGRGAKPVEVEGLAKPLAARVMALAAGGQTLLTHAARHALADAAPPDTQIEPHGHYRLKGIEEPVEIFALVQRGRPLPPAPQDTDKAYRVVRRGDLWLPARDVPHRLPAERDAFVGRLGELHALARRLQEGVRLLTVLGPGGTGKTRLVCRYGWTWLGEWPGGVFFCDLSEARSSDGLVFAVSSALGVPLGKDDPVAQLGHAIAGRGRCLLVLDNFEQVVQLAPGTLGAWLDRAGDAVFVVTSRERLHLAGEQVFQLDPLQLDHEAIELFATRARAHRADFELGDDNRAAVAEVVRLLDGLPLAIELAAARVRVLSPAQLLERMRNRFQLLAGARSASTRQATLQAAIDWSWQLLTPWEQDALAQCSIFEGGFSLRAAEAVLDLSAWPAAPPTIDVVQALSDKSLLRTWLPLDDTRHDIDEPYFGMYLSIHEYASHRLQAAGQPARARAGQRHGRYFAGFGTAAAIDALYRHRGVRLRRMLAIELDNLVATCRRAVARGQADEAVASQRAIWEVLDLQGPCALAIELATDVLAMTGLDAAQRATALLTQATALRRAGRSEDAATRFEQALVLSRTLDEPLREAEALNHLGNLRRDQGSMAVARGHLEAALVIARNAGQRRMEGHLLGNLGIVHAELGRLDEGRSHFEQALAIHREVGNRRIEGIDTGNLGLVLADQGRVQEAEARFVQALAIHREVGNRRDEGIVIGNLGLLLSDQRQWQRAREHYNAALLIDREVGDRRHEGFVLGALATALGELGHIEECLAQCELALAIHRAAGNRRAEGSVLATMGDVRGRQGRFAEAREHLRGSEAVLRDIGAGVTLVALLCTRGRLELAAGDRHAAGHALAQAEAAATGIAATSDSRPGQEIAALREALRVLPG